ncbi:tafazzin-like [Watersipora subatra]|uniref:tafazzin-like n=1 Tax=Watersipora subatra TaxID=2589382 RepID=UPI00355BC01C
MSDPDSFSWPFNGDAYQRRIWKFNSIVVQSVVWSAAKLWTSRPLNGKILYHADRLTSLLDERCEERKKKGYNKRPLITISNHRCCADDPLIWGVLLRWRHILYGQMRWIPAAAELTFTNPAYSFVFGHGQCVPVVRGRGVYQKGIDFCVDRLNEGQWVHVFPEGKVNIDDTRRLKWGIGRMIADCEVVPDVIPIWFTGMDRILPNKSPYRPRIGQTVIAFVGEPIKMEQLVVEWKKETSDSVHLRKKITDYLEVEFWQLKERATSHQQKLLGISRNTGG